MALRDVLLCFDLVSSNLPQSQHHPNIAIGIFFMTPASGYEVFSHQSAARCFILGQLGVEGFDVLRCASTWTG